MVNQPRERSARPDLDRDRNMPLEMWSPGGDMCLQIFPGEGGSFTIRYGGISILGEGKRTDGNYYRTHLCAPYFGEVDGFKRHGALRKDTVLISQEVDEQGRAVMVLSYDIPDFSAKEGVEIPVHLEQRFSFTEKNELTVKTRVTNNSDRPITTNLAYHNYFSTRLASGTTLAAVEDSSTLEIEDLIAQPNLKDFRIIPLSNESKIRPAGLTDLDGNQIVVTLQSSDFHAAALWNGSRDSICIEPSQKDPRYPDLFTAIQPGEVSETTMVIAINKESAIERWYTERRNRGN